MKRKRDEDKPEENENKKRKVEEVEVINKSESVGILQYTIQDESPIRGIIKQNSFDFHVKEVFEKKIVYLTSCEPIIEESFEKDYNFGIKLILEEIPNFPKEKFDVFYKNYKNEIKFDLPFYIESKEKRKKIHEIVRNYLKLSSRVLEENKKKIFRIYYEKNPRRNMWPQNRPKYLEFVLFKFNVDTKTALNIIADKIRVKIKNFSYCGIKDKRACTSQLVRLRRTPCSKLLKFNENERFQNKKSSHMLIRTGNFKYVPQNLMIGQLDGNFFSIALREVEFKNESNNFEDDMNLVNLYLSKFKELGFVNYFGLQRFGSRSIGTHKIGIEMLKNNWEGVLKLITNEQKFEVNEIMTKFWIEKNYTDTLNELKKHRNVHSHLKIVSYLKNDPQNYKNALDRCIPRTLRTFYIHSYQSFLWNHLVSDRIANFGLKPVVGDMVFVNKETEKEKKQKIRIIRTEEELKSISIFDIVCPIPGSDIIYPTIGNYKKLLVDLMKDDHLEISTFQKNEKHFNSFGKYRKMIIKPEKISWKFEKYPSNSSYSLIKTDLEMVENVSELKVNLGSSKMSLNTENKENESLALVLNFALPSGSYATQAIRQILK